ncbi:hypothetical protein HU200_042754 [Digitaria exilis]|uniref:Phytosulfokine-beta n=1 Tax=Digitaria exilis TaxID=1010633 RepID=A0A835BG10_9POAL|nr:hypothetical protein HU200_042754 [Digitaria exilis]
MHGRRMSAMAMACLLCLLLAPLLAAQGARPSRKLLSTAQQEKPTSHGGIGNHGAGTTATPEEPGSGGRGSGSRGSSGTDEARCDTAKWAEIHTDYIYTQDVKHP